MKKVLILLSALAVMACAAPKDNTLTRAEKADGWELLFDGQTLNGWRSFNELALVGESWVVEDGTIAATGKGDDAHGYIVTDRVFENFHLKWDWKISKGGNSGMLYHVQ